jgi:predicted permease
VIDGPRLSRAALGTLFYVLAPFISFFSLAHLHVTRAVGVGLALGYLELAIVGALAWLIASRVLRLSRPQVGAVTCSVIVVNTGYLGLPMARALLGRDSLGAAIAFDALVSGPMFYVVGFLVANLLGDRPPRGAAIRRIVLGNPPLLAAVAGLLAPASLAPQPLVDLAHALVWALLILGFFAVGITLAAEAGNGGMAFPPPFTAPVGVAVALRVVAAPALFALLAAASGGVPRAYLVQAAMPCGINSLVLSHLFGLDVRIAASAIAWSTTIVVAAGLAVWALGGVT